MSPGTGRTVVCTCGHALEAHRHYRRGTDCALCDCQRWSPDRWWRRLLPPAAR